MCEYGSDGKSDDNVPDEESDDGMVGDVALLPSDFGMGDEGHDGSDSGSDEIGEPEEIVVFDDKIGDDGEKNIVEESNADADEEIADGVLAGFDVLGGFGVMGGRRLVFGCIFAVFHTVYYTIWTEIEFFGII